MSYVTIVWSVIAAGALVLGALHTLVWLLDRRALANLAFASVAFGAAGVTALELAMMNASSAAEWGHWVRWYQLPNFFLIVGTVVFIKLYLGTGRAWLMWTLIALRVTILLSNFAVEPNFNFERIDSIAQVSLFGEQISIVGDATTAPRQWIATVAALLSIVYVLDAAISLWRTGTADARRKALVVGGAIAFFFAIAIVNTQLVVWGLLKTPTLTAPPFLITLVAMGFEMSRDTLRASRLARELHESERALQLAASAAGLGLWSWDVTRRRLWATHRARSLFGLDDTGPLEPRDLLPRISTEDVARVSKALHAAEATGMEQEVEFCVHAPGDAPRWLVARGRWERDTPSGRKLIRGVLREVTDQHRTQEELEELRRELAHAGRLSTLGQLTSTLAHELRQPLTAMLSNAQAARLLLRMPHVDRTELTAILEDIQRDNSRAAEVIDRLQAMLKRRPMDIQALPIEALLHDVSSILRNDAVRRGVALETSVEAATLVAEGDRVHLSQVLINLIMNAMDAVAPMPPSRRRVAVHARRADAEWIEIAITDSGAGIPTDVLPTIFDPFFTTKPAGMGMGLAISRTIVEAHRGRLTVENNPTDGATFRVVIPRFTAGSSSGQLDRLSGETIERGRQAVRT